MIEHKGRDAQHDAAVDRPPQERHDLFGNDDEHKSEPPAWAPMQERAVARELARLRGMLRTPAVALPYRSELEQAFGTDLGDVRAHVGESAALSELGAVAAADGNVVAFADASPSRATVAHEVTHVLQARSGGGGGGAEAEAERAEGNVAAGFAPGPITEGATGVHRKSGEAAPPATDARAFLQELPSVEVIVVSMLDRNQALESHPYAPYFKMPEALVRVMFGHGGPGMELMTPFHDKIGGLIAPEPLDVLVNKARRTLTPSGTVGPAHHIYIDPVGLELANALTRRLRQSMTRMVPRYVNAAGLARDAEGKLAAARAPDAGSLVPSHPVDRIVAHGLCARGLEVDAPRFASDHPELVAAAGRAQSRAVAVRFPYERKLWHWVEASPADATAEEVALAIFGAEDHAYRLTPVPPLFGFRGADVAAFVPERRAELHALAVKHMPHPDAVEQSAEDSEPHPEPAQSAQDSTGPVDAGVPMPAGIPEVAKPPPPPVPGPHPGYPDYRDVDPVAELAAATDDKFAVERAKQNRKDNVRRDEAAVHERLADCIDLVEPARAAFASLGLATDGLDSHRSGFLSKQRAARATCVADCDGWYALADQQARLLKRIATGAGDTSAHLLLYGGVNRKDAGGVTPSPSDLPDVARVPIVEAAEAFRAVVDALALPEIAAPRIEHAEQLRRNLRIAVLENSLQQTLPTVQDAMDTPGDRHKNGADYDPQDLDSRNTGMLFELGRLRVQTETDPAVAEQRLGKVQGLAGDYTFEVAVVSNLEALDAVWRAVEDTEDFWKSGIDEVIGNRLQANNRAWYTKFKSLVHDPYKAAVANKDEKAREAAKQAFKQLVEGEDFKAHFKEVQEHLEDDASHKKWTKIIVGIGIAVVAMGLGQWYFGAYLAAGGGVLAASVGAAVIETGVSTVLNKLILDVNPTAGSLITGFLGSAGMYALVGRALAVGRAAGAGAEVVEATVKASALAKLGKVAVATTKEALLVQALGLVQAAIAARIDGASLTEDQLKEIFVHNLAGLVGMKIGQRVVDVTLDPMKPLRQIGARHQIDVDGLFTEQTELRKLAARVEETKDPELAQTLIEREQRFLARERDVRLKLIELGEARPGQVPAGKLKELAAMPDRAPDAEVAQAQALMSLEEVGPGLYRADARAFDAILDLHKQSHDRLVGVDTDPHTGLRTLKFETADGVSIRIKEKLADIDERTAPPIPVEQARHFERWLESEPLHADPVQSDLYRQRLRESYARDPQAAIETAGRYGFDGASAADTAPLATKPAAGAEHPAARPKRDADRAYEQQQYDQRGDGRKMSRIGEEPLMDRSDFDAMYKAGYEYDPVGRRWVLSEGRTTSAGRVGSGSVLDSKAPTQVLDTVHSEAVGHQLLRKLVAGEAEALRVIGIEPPPGFDPRHNEWALGRRKSDDAIVLIRGKNGEVDWSQIPDIEDLAHSHPLYDSKGDPRLLQGRDGSGTISIHDLGSFQHSDLVKLLPSTDDLRFVALGGRAGHRVHTPYVSLGNGKIGNPTNGHMLDTVEVVIAHAEPHALMGPGSEFIIWRAEIEIWAGETLLRRTDLYQQFAPMLGDVPSFTPQSFWVPLPASHPARAAATGITGMSHASDIGYVDANTVQRLMTLGLDPTVAATEHLLASMSQRDAAALHGLSFEAIGGRVSGFEHWLARLQGPGERQFALADARAAHNELASHAGATIAIGSDGAIAITNMGERDASKLGNPSQVLRDRQIPESTIKALALDTTTASLNEAVLIDLARVWTKLESRGLRSEFGDARINKMLRELLAEPYGPRIMEIVGSGQLDTVPGFERILSQLFHSHTRSTFIVVLERALLLKDKFVFEPLKEGASAATNESGAQRARRVAREASGEAPRVDASSDVDIGIPDRNGGWHELYQMKYVEAVPTTVGHGQVVTSIGARVKKAASKGAAQLQSADKAQIDAGKPPATKIVEVRAEAPRDQLDPADWAAKFVHDAPEITVLIYSTEGGAPWRIPS